jgi:hypothetical protein
LGRNVVTAPFASVRIVPESVEYLEARAEGKRRQEKKAEVPKPEPVGPTSEEFAAMNKDAGGRYPWMWYEDRKA